MMKALEYYDATGEMLRPYPSSMDVIHERHPRMKMTDMNRALVIHNNWYPESRFESPISDVSPSIVASMH